jgi:hypothetical protein
MSWLSLVPYLAAGAIAASATWPVARAPLQTAVAQLRMENAALRETNAESVRLASLAAAARVQEAQRKSEVLGAGLLAAAAQNATLAKEKAHALQAATSGRACLSDRALRVLNQSPGLAVSGLARVPAPGPGAAAPGGPAAPHTNEPNEPAGQQRTATDADIGTWAIAAGQQYEDCRRRLDALISWHDKPAPASATQSPNEGHRP